MIPFHALLQYSKTALHAAAGIPPRLPCLEAILDHIGGPLHLSRTMMARPICRCDGTPHALRAAFVADLPATHHVPDAREEAIALTGGLLASAHRGNV